MKTKMMIGTTKILTLNTKGVVMQTSFTIGCDPELFLKNHQDKLISVVGLIGGTKENPMPIGNGCAIQEDNVAAEFCIPPCATEDEFVSSIMYALGDIDQRAQALGLTMAALTAFLVIS